MANTEREPITVVWRSRGRAPGQEVKGAKPPKAENLLALDAQRKQQICLILRILQTP